MLRVLKADFAAVAADLRRHLPAIRACTGALQDAVTVSRRFRFGPDPHGVLHPEVGGIMRGLHFGQDELFMLLTHNLILFEVRFEVAAAALGEGDPAAADAAMLDGKGVDDPEEAKPAPPPSGRDWPENLPDHSPPDSIAAWRCRLRLARRAATWLCGDSRAFAEHSRMWRDLANDTDRAADAFAAAVNTELESWRGPGAASYQSMIRVNIEIIYDLRRHCESLSRLLDACAWLALLSRHLLEATLDACLAELGEPDAASIPVRAWAKAAGSILWDLADSAAEIRRNNA